MWPSWELLEAPKDPFNIEREARLHRQAAGECGAPGLLTELYSGLLDLGYTRLFAERREPEVSRGCPMYIAQSVALLATQTCAGCGP